MLAREEFEARMETMETRMDARVANIENKFDHYIALQAERDVSRALLDSERDKRLEERDKRLEERDKRLDERDLRLEKLAESAEGLKSTIWLAAVTTMVTVALAFFGTAISSFYATQSSNLAIVQATISAFQQGQNTPIRH